MIGIAAVAGCRRPEALTQMSSDDSTSASEPPGDKNRRTGPKVSTMGLGDSLRDFYLTASGNPAVLSILRFRSREGDEQQRDRISVAAFVSLRISGQDSREEDVIEL